MQTHNRLRLIPESDDFWKVFAIIFDVFMQEADDFYSNCSVNDAEKKLIGHEADDHRY